MLYFFHSMSQFLLHFVLRPIEALVGLFLILTAVLLYRNEDKAIRNKLEDFWIRVDDYQKLALSKHATFMTGVANLESRLLDRLFGQRLVSVQLLCVSLFLSVGVPGILAFLWEARFHHFERSSFGSQFLGVSISSFIATVGAVLYQKNKFLRRVTYVVAVIFLTCWAKYTFSSHAHLHHSALQFLEPVLTAIAAELAMVVKVMVPTSTGIAFDIGFIVATRVLLRWAGKMTSSLKVLAIVLANCLLALILESPLLIIALFYRQGKLPYENSPGRNFLIFIAAFTSLGNVLDLCFALLFIFLAIMLMLHRGIWPLLNRSLFRLTDIGITGRRIILLTIGMALFKLSHLGGKPPALLQKLIEILAG